MKDILIASAIVASAFGLFGLCIYSASSDVHGEPGYSYKAAKAWAVEMGEPNPHVVCRYEYWCHGGIDFETTNCDVKVADKIYTVSCSAKSGKCNL